MYVFCKQRDLREVWGYMWACWYSPQRWPLWARSSDGERLSRLRTTMTVENHWKQVKHIHLHNLVHPRLDQLVYILIYEVTPVIAARTPYLDSIFRLGAARPLTTWQKGFKSSWQNLMKRNLSGKQYQTIVDAWTCTCGRQKFDPHHLCKHLVQAVPPPSANFWVEIRRRRTMPLYRHPELHEKDKLPGEYEEGGNVTDGDDDVWSGNKESLANGEWRKLKSVVLGKRPREMSVDDSEPGRRNTQAPRCGGSSDAPTVLSHGEEDENEMDEIDERVDDLIAGLEGALEILRTQKQRGSRRWLKGILDRGIGSNAVQMYQDVNWYTKERENRHTTWAPAGDREAARRRQNTMFIKL
ncbi:hypothetical protein B0H14DRAFT_3088937 [Mycena olivaceomarginata]|nr:hypothetical protein B0H14DRAFT_3088937 [Mycena olivaceomarginata]